MSDIFPDLGPLSQDSGNTHSNVAMSVKGLEGSSQKPCRKFREDEFVVPRSYES